MTPPQAAEAAVGSALDVLSVLDHSIAADAAAHCNPLWLADMREARAAVAELVDAANGMLDVTGRGKVCTVTESLAAYRRLETALARVLNQAPTP